MAIVKRQTKKGIRFQVKVRDKWSEWFQSETFDTLEEAQVHEKAVLELKEKGIRASIDHTCIDGSPVSALSTFAELKDAWAMECRGKVSNGWRQSQEQMLRDYIMPFVMKKVGNKEITFAETPICEIEPRNIGNLLSGVAALGRAPSMVRHIYTLLRDIFSDAIEHFGCKLERHPVLRRYEPEVDKTERAFLHPSESVILLEFVSDHYLGPAIWVGILAGLRPCEIQALTWKNVDWVSNCILIRAAWNRKEKRMQDYPKQGDWGRTPMPKVLREYLWARRSSPHAFVCPNNKGGMLSYHTLQKALGRICTEAGVHKITPHELRHSATELWVESDASQVDVQRMLNHKSASSTVGYMHRTNGRLQKLSERVGLSLLRVVSGNEDSVPACDQGVA